MADKRRRATDADLLSREGLRGLLPEDINDGDLELPPVDLDPLACEQLWDFLSMNLADGERARQAYNSTVEIALRRHAAADPNSDWRDFAKSIGLQVREARALYRSLETAEARSRSLPRRWEASLLTRAAGVVEAGGLPRYRRLTFEARLRARDDPLEYLAAQNETLALKKIAARRLRVLALATAAIKSRKGRPRGGPLYPLITRLANYWNYAAQELPTYGRREELRDGPLDVQSHVTTTGPFFRYCELALNCLREDQRHGQQTLESVVRAICDAGESIKAGYSDDLYRI